MIPYFAELGMGFILIELALLQKLILLLGNPTTTFAILLFTLLISSGSGSLLSSRVARNNMKNLIFVIGGIAPLALFYVLFLPSIVYSTITEPFYVKAVVAASYLGTCWISDGYAFSYRDTATEGPSFGIHTVDVGHQWCILCIRRSPCHSTWNNVWFILCDDFGGLDVSDCIRNIFRIEEKDHS